MSDKSSNALLWPVDLAKRLYANGALERTVTFERKRGSHGYLVFQTRWGELGCLAMSRTAKAEAKARELSSGSARALLEKKFPGAIMAA